MSSLLQFSGDISRRGVHLECYRVISTPKADEYRRRLVNLGAWIGVDARMGDCYDDDDPADRVDCPVCNRDHPRLYTFTRKPAGMFGCWVQFRYHGQVHSPDLSVPLQFRVLPQGCTAMTDEETCSAWHRS